MAWALRINIGVATKEVHWVQVRSSPWARISSEVAQVHYFARHWQYLYCIKGAEFAWLEFAGLENDGVEQKQTYILHTMKWTQTNVYDT